jgi:hypothetical protein
MLAVNPLENLGNLGVAVLAVVGGAVVGAVVTSVAVWLVSRYYFKKTLPAAPRTLLRWLGAFAGALLVAGFLSLGGAGWGPFGGGGPGFGAGAAGDSAGTDAAKSAAADAAKGQDAKATDPPARGGERVRVIVLGGSLVQGRAFYRIEGQRQPSDLDAVREFVRRRQGESPPLGGVDILIYQNSSDANTEQVKQLRAWALGSGLTPHVVELSGDIPPP